MAFNPFDNFNLFGGKKQPTLPPPPTYQNSPYFSGGGIGDLYGLGNQITSGDFTGNLSWLQPTINQNNGQNALSYAQGLLQPQFRDTLQQINNNAAANNQTNSSTYTDALARSQSDLNSQYQSILSAQAIQDSQQSNANRLSLFGTGLNTLNSAVGYGGQAEGMQNNFNLGNYENQLAYAYGTQPPQNGGLGGALQGAIGGGLAGLSTGNPYIALAGAAAGGLGGALSTQASNFGGQLGQLGAGLYGQAQKTQSINRLTGLFNYAPGSAATNSLDQQYSNVANGNNYYQPLSLGV